MEQQNAVALFEQKHMEAFKQLSELNKEQNRLSKIEKDVKAELEVAMESNDIVGIKNEYITISRVAASKTTTIDLDMLQEKEPELYAELLKDYPKTKTTKASIRFLVK